MKKILIALCFVAGVFVAPLAAQTVVRLFGTTSGGTILPLLVDSTGRITASISGAFTPQMLGPTNCTTAPAYSFTGDPNTGYGSSAADALCVVTGGSAKLQIGATADTIGILPDASERYRFTASGLLINSTEVVAWGSPLASPDITLGRLAADVVAVGAGDAYGLAAKAWIRTAPTIGSGFGTSPSIVASNGTAAFTINVGTGGTASSGVVTMPAATTGYNCHVENRTGVLGNVANQRSMQIATTTTSITVENQTISTGAALAWTASDVLAVMCTAY